MQPIASIYINLEDDVSRIVARLKKEKHQDIVLVCPKRCLLFADGINLRLLKKQVDLLGKDVSILTMDEKGQQYAKEAGFSLRSLPKPGQNAGVLDIKPASKPIQVKTETKSETKTASEPSDITLPKNKVIKKSNSHTATPQPKILKIQNLKPSVSDLPPALNNQDQLPPLKVSESVFPKEIEIAHRAARSAKNAQRVVISLIVFSLLAILGAVFIILPKATVAVFPKTEPVTRDIVDINANTKVLAVDPANSLLPAQKVSENLELTNKFQAQGKRELGNKAKGTVRIYNFSKQPLNLKASTTILTVGNKSYHLINDIAGLRVTTYKDPKTKEVDPASLDAPVEVTADQGGEDFNLPAGVRMEITNQVFGSKPQFLFAKSETAILGGTSRFLSVVNQQDIESSRNTLGDQLVKMVNDKLKANGQILLDKAYTIEVLQFITDKPAGTESPTFTATLKAKITGLAISPDQLNDLVKNRISLTLASNKTLESTSAIPAYRLQSVDLNQEQAIISVHFEGKAVMNLNLENAAEELVGKSRSQAAEILRSKAEVDRIDITLAPSWQNNFPYLKSKIKIYIERNSPN